ncbi:MAG: hypothetical protein A07HR60_02289 [uncultured archaeon A07HR60]|nr:MAG: hypothetical protein A07HR60_02289 [uncultured archaeon A07HR60]
MSYLRFSVYLRAFTAAVTLEIKLPNFRIENFLTRETLTDRPALQICSEGESLMGSRTHPGLDCDKMGWDGLVDGRLLALDCRLQREANFPTEAVPDDHQ